MTKKRLENKKIAKLYLSGKTMKEIGEKLGASTTGIRKRLIKMGIPRRGARDYTVIPTDDKWIAELYDKGYSTYRIAGELNIGQSIVWNRLRKMGHSMRECGLIRKTCPIMKWLYLDCGMTAEEIGKLYGCHTGSIYQYFRTIGVLKRGSSAGPTKGSKLAKCLVRQAIDKGTLIPQPCEECGYDGLNKNGARGVHAHHPDYNHPLKIIWLCSRCHQAWHRKYSAIPLTTN